MESGKEPMVQLMEMKFGALTLTNTTLIDLKKNDHLIEELRGTASLFDTTCGWTSTSTTNGEGWEG